MLRSLIVILIFIAVGLPNIFIPFVLSGVLDSAVPAETLLGLLGVVIVAGTALVVLGEMSSGLHELVRAMRSRALSRRRAVWVVCWAAFCFTVVCSSLGYFSVSPVRYIALLRDMQSSIGSGWLFLIATTCWRIPQKNSCQRMHNV